MEINEDVANRQLKEALLQKSYLWEELTTDAEQLILFGSWSVFMQRADSDIDLLCIGSGKRFKRNHLDLVWVSQSELFSDRWLGSELANHVAHFGVWLNGHDNWSDRVFISESAIKYKEKLIRYRMKALRRLWSKLRFDYTVKHVVKLRRDIQRLALMNMGQPVAPSPLLDRQWAALGATAVSLIQLLQETRTPNLMSFQDIELIEGNLPYLDWNV